MVAESVTQTTLGSVGCGYRINLYHGFWFTKWRLADMNKHINTWLTGATSWAVGILILGYTIVGCTQLTPSNDRPRIKIAVSEPDRIRYSGKGAGAGMMMAGAMGPMGIAIGVAIDEGIGKDIDRTARQGNINIQTLLLEAAAEALNQPDNPLASYGADTIEIVVERYGFVTASGEGDPVQPQLHVKFLFNADNKKALRIPEDFKDDMEFVFDTYQLDDIKGSAEAIRQAFEKIAEFAVNHGLIST